MVAIINKAKQISKLKPEQIFMLSVLLVNGGNYLYNLLLGRILGPEAFSDAAIMITFLLALSFVAMTFQLVTAKFSATLSGNTLLNFITKTLKNSLFTGVIFGLLIVVFAKQLQAVFNTSSYWMFIIFGLGTPLYFAMSANRGVFQGKKEFKKLSITYQGEMLSRLLITLGLILVLSFNSSVLVSIGILISFVFGLLPFNISLKSTKTIKLDSTLNRHVKHFFIVTAFYELTQITINNSDILLVKHYFDAYEAGLYASLALIGRIVYFIAWMFVMLLLPTVIELKKEHKPTAPVLFKYLGYIAFISLSIVLACYIMPETIITILFGDSYIAMAPLLWKYAVATSLFALSNIFAYYYLSLDKYASVIISGLFGMLQVGLIILYHNSLEQVVNLQILAMVLLLVVQILFFTIHTLKEKRL